MIEIKDLLERVEPLSFDECRPKSDFLFIVSTPKFKELLEKELSCKRAKEWLEMAEKSKIYFIINDDSWKNTNSPFPNSLNLCLIGESRIPVISINMHKKLV